MKLFLLSLFVCFSGSVSAQKIYGTVFGSQGDLLPYSSVTIKGTTRGTSANDKGKYALNVVPGTYTLVCQHLGYTISEKTIVVTNDTEVSFTLSEQKLTLETVVIRNDGEDPAYAIIRNSIKKRNFYRDQVEQFTCNIYGKDMIKVQKLPKKILGQKLKEEDRKEMGVDSAGKGIIYLSESVSKISVRQNPDKFKLEVISSRVSGSDGFGFNFPAFISLYSSNVKVFTERFNPRGFISPISDGAIGFYKFKLLGSFFENGKEINSIRVTPRRKYEPLFSGIINITEGEWSIHSFDLILTKSAQLEIMDTLHITQLHVPVDKDIRRVKNQLLHFNFKQFGIDAVGNFLTVYSDYNVHPALPKKFFDNVLVKYDTASNKKTPAYWDSVRAVPLEKEEELDYRKKDSTFRSDRDSLNSSRSLDSINKHQPKVKPLDVLTKGIRRFHLSKAGNFGYGLDPLIFNTEYNPAEGVAISVNPFISNYKNKSRVGMRLEADLRYGFLNKHFNPSGTLILTGRSDSLRKIRRYAVAFSGGKRVSQFNKESAFSPLKNTISTLLYGKNYLKTYENYYGSITYTKRYESGLRVSLQALYEDRIPLDNITKYTFSKKDSSNLTPNFPYEKIPVQFTPHQAVIISVTASFKPGQRFVQFPTYKTSIGSDYPTFTINYTKGVKNIIGSDVNFDKWRFSISDDKNLKLAGTLKYKFGIGGFLNRKNVFIQDYQHFNGNRTLGASEYVNSFQLAPYYRYSTTASFYAIGHVEQHLNGLLTNKIPLFRKLNWNIVAGSNAFYVNKDNNYVELFAGLENIFKLFRVDGVIGYQSDGGVTSGIRIGAGGLLGATVRTNRSDNSISIGF